MTSRTTSSSLHYIAGNGETFATMGRVNESGEIDCAFDPKIRNSIKFSAEASHGHMILTCKMRGKEYYLRESYRQTLCLRPRTYANNYQLWKFNPRSNIMSNKGGEYNTQFSLHPVGLLRFISEDDKFTFRLSLTILENVKFEINCKAGNSIKEFSVPQNFTMDCSIKVYYSKNNKLCSTTSKEILLRGEIKEFDLDMLIDRGMRRMEALEKRDLMPETRHKSRKTEPIALADNKKLTAPHAFPRWILYYTSAALLLYLLATIM